MRRLLPLLLACTGTVDVERSTGGATGAGQAELAVLWGGGMQASMLSGCVEGRAGTLSVLVQDVYIENRSDVPVDAVRVQMLGLGVVRDLGNARVERDGAAWRFGERGVAPGEVVRGTLRVDDEVEAALCDGCGEPLQLKVSYESGGRWSQAADLTVGLMACGALVQGGEGEGEDGWSCTTDEDCLAGCYCDPAASDECIETALCEADADCGDGQVCEAARLTCRPPADDGGDDTPL